MGVAMLHSLGVAMLHPMGVAMLPYHQAKPYTFAFLYEVLFVIGLCDRTELKIAHASCFKLVLRQKTIVLSVI